MVYYVESAAPEYPKIMNRCHNCGRLEEYAWHDIFCSSGCRMDYAMKKKKLGLKENALGELEMEDDLAEKGAKATYSVLKICVQGLDTGQSYTTLTAAMLSIAMDENLKANTLLDRILRLGLPQNRELTTEIKAFLEDFDSAKYKEWIDGKKAELRNRIVVYAKFVNQAKVLINKLVALVEPSSPPFPLEENTFPPQGPEPDPTFSMLLEKPRA